MATFFSRSVQGRAPRPSARQAVLSAWRGVDLAPLEKAKASRAKSTADLMPGVLKEIGLDRRRADAEVGKVWNQLVSPDVAAHAQPVNLCKGTLFVTVDSSVWLDEIVRYRRKEILDRLQHSFGRDLIAKISFRVG